MGGISVYRAAVTKYRRLSSLKRRNVLFHSACWEKSKLKVSAETAPSEDTGKGFLPSFWHTTSVYPCILPVCTSVSLHGVRFIRTPGMLDWGPTLLQYVLILIKPETTLFQIMSRPWALERSFGIQHMSLGEIQFNS